MQLDLLVMNVSQDVDLFGCKKMMSGVTRFTELVEGLGVTGAKDADAKTTKYLSCKDS